MRILAERQHESLSLDVSWLDRLIQEERAGGATPGPSGPAATAAGAGAGSAAACEAERRPAPGGQAGPPRQCFTIAASGARPGGTGTQPP